MRFRSPERAVRSTLSASSKERVVSDRRRGNTLGSRPERSSPMRESDSRLARAANGDRSFTPVRPMSKSSRGADGGQVGSRRSRVAPQTSSVCSEGRAVTGERSVMSVPLSSRYHKSRLASGTKSTTGCRFSSRVSNRVRPDIGDRLATPPSDEVKVVRFAANSRPCKLDIPLQSRRSVKLSISSCVIWAPAPLARVSATHCRSVESGISTSVSADAMVAKTRATAPTYAGRRLPRQVYKTDRFPAWDPMRLLVALSMAPNGLAEHCWTDDDSR